MAFQLFLFSKKLRLGILEGKWLPITCYVRVHTWQDKLVHLHTLLLNDPPPPPPPPHTHTMPSHCYMHPCYTAVATYVVKCWIESLWHWHTLYVFSPVKILVLSVPHPDDVLNPYCLLQALPGHSARWTTYAEQLNIGDSSILVHTFTHLKTHCATHQQYSCSAGPWPISVYALMQSQYTTYLSVVSPVIRLALSVL